MAKKITARRSQLLTTYGVGSLFPAENTSYLIAGLHLWNERSLPAVVEPRLARQLGVRELKAPPATPENRNKPGVPVTRFPRVLQCPECNALGTPNQLNASLDEPRCGICDAKPPLIPSRFISACRAGHLSDFPYYEWVHDAEYPPKDWGRTQYPKGNPTSTDSAVHVLRLRSRGRTSALGDLVVECSCKKRRSLDKAFNKSATKAFRCAGERPWLGFEYRESKCGEERTTVQRGASNVWFALATSAISIPPYSGHVAKIVSKNFKLLKEIPKRELSNAAATGVHPFLETILRAENTSTDVRSFARQALETAYPDEKPAVSDEEFRFQEYEALMKGGEEGAESQFTCHAEPIGEGLSTWIGSVRRVSRLREVRALSGFTRITAAEQQLDGQEAAIAAIRPEDDPSSWLPANELLGEGLFIALDRDRLGEWARTPLARRRAELLQKNSGEAAYRRAARAGVDIETAQVDIVQVAVHTLAHALVDQLALEAGYPASSLRERLFVSADMAGILVYTASSDSSGSLGGVASMADPERLAVALAEAEDRLSWCSSDPVCVESTGTGTDGGNLAACHNCVLLPETSCEEFNLGLDRGVVFGTPDEPHSGLIAWLREHPQHAPTVDERNIAGKFGVPDIIADRSWKIQWEATDMFKRTIEMLAEEEAEAPEVGPEIGSEQITVDFAWPKEMLVLTSGLSKADADSLEEQGWTICPEDEEFEEAELVDQLLSELS